MDREPPGGNWGEWIGRPGVGAPLFLRGRQTKPAFRHAGLVAPAAEPKMGDSARGKSELDAVLPPVGGRGTASVRRSTTHALKSKMDRGSIGGAVGREVARFGVTKEP